MDSKADSQTHIALKLVETRGSMTDRDIEDIHGAGFDDGAIAAVVAQVALNVFTNYFNHVARTGITVTRIGLVVVLVWIGSLKVFHAVKAMR